MRSFIAIPMPEEVCNVLAAVQAALPLGRVVAGENLHLTLVFLGDVAEPLLEEVHFALETLRHPAFDLTLSGLDTFGSDRPQSLNIAARAAPELTELQRRIRSRLLGIGVETERRRFVPHVTLARFGKSISIDESGRIGRFLASRADLRLPPFRVRAFGLYQSILTADGAHYEVLADYPLTGS